MQLGFYRSNYLIRMYSEKQTKICFFFFSSHQPFLPPFLCRNTKLLELWRPAVCQRQPRNSHDSRALPVDTTYLLRTTTYVFAEREREAAAELNTGKKKRSLLQRLSEGTVFSGSCILCLRMIKTETETGGSLGNVHKSQSTEFITELVYSISVLRIQRYCGSHA